MTKTLIATAVLLLCFTLSTAHAATGPGTQAVRKANDTVAKLLRKKVAAGSDAEAKLATKITAELRGFLDVEELGKRAMSDHWDKLEPAKRTEFMNLLRDLIEANYVKGLRANLDYEVSYAGESPKGDNLLVTTEIKTMRRGRPYKIEIQYLLRKDGSGWRTFDVVTDGVGLVENYRAMFNKIIAKEGVDGLIARMRTKLATI
ncbi:MAG TPA: ABC transporter substrate-binding protein [Kofleriaceae bacterium]|nr:ABC transporter substrate-binding protein [Kofleriaceae bacterium]